jgi:tetratricopeptide (TPR) repeat protein
MAGVVMSLAACAARGADTAPFDVANQLYEAEKFDEAKAAYEVLVKSGTLSANLFYDLGNTEWKLGNAGAAAADYERALELEPSHPQARANLDFVRDQTGARIATQQWWEQALGEINANTATLLAAVCGWVALFCLVTMWLRPGGKMGPLVTVTLCVIGGAYAGGCIWEARIQAGKAIVIVKTTEARPAPTEVAPVTDTLPAGSEVLAPEVRGPWTYCTLPDGTRAWVPTEALEKLREG